LTRPTFRRSVWTWVLCLAAGNGLAYDGPPDERLFENLHVFGHAPPPAAAVPSGSPATERIRIQGGGEEGGAMDMVVFEPGAKPVRVVPSASTPAPPQATTTVTPDFEPPKPGALGRKGSPLYGWDADFFLRAGYRQDHLDFTVSGTELIRIRDTLLEIPWASVLEWEDLHIAEAQGNFSLTSPAGWHLRGRVGHGWILEGENQDSDFLSHNRSFEFSRSNNEADRGHVFDASLGFGHRFVFGGDAQKPWLSLTPLVGYSYHMQNLRMHDFHQTVSDFGFPIPVGTRSKRLNNRYETQWHGPWLGLGLQATVWDRIDLFGEAAHHWASYHAQAQWNLRREFMQPRSFVHNTEGTGVTARVGARYRAATNWALEVVADYQRWQSDPGEYTVFFSDGTSGSAKLNEVNRDSFGLGVGFGYSF
jgi:hypothetical protein